MLFTATPSPYLNPYGDPTGPPPYHGLLLLLALQVDSSGEVVRNTWEDCDAACGREEA